jgi:hypothetical protein
MKKVLMILIFASCFLKLNAQFSINDYKYVIVEKQFHFQNEPNQYNLNELTRFLLKKHGFRPVLESDVFPNDLKSDYCLALQCEVTAKGFLKTTVTVSLKDCNNNIIFETEGTTKEKDFDKVYAYGIRKAFENFKDLKYNYVPKKTSANASAEKAKEIKDNADEVEQLKAEIEELKKAKELKINEQALQKEQELKPIVEDKSKNIKTNNIYFEAIAIDNGYNLVNAENKKVIHVLTKTGMDNVFTVKGNNGIVYKKDGKWMLEYTKGKKTVVEIINIIF